MPDLLSDLQDAGLPIGDDGEPTRPLTPSERIIRQAIKLKYLPEFERVQALKRRPDLAKRLGEVEQAASERPHKKSLRDEYRAAMDKLGGIIDAESFTAAQRDAAIRTIARILRLVLRLVARMARADDE